MEETLEKGRENKKIIVDILCHNDSKLIFVKTK